MKLNFDKNKVFINIESPLWRGYTKISVDELFSDVYQRIDEGERVFIDNISLIRDSSSLKVQVNPLILEHPSVFSESFIDQNISYTKPPKDVSTVSGMHLMTDGNYLYIWVGDRWKRTVLSEW